MGVKTFSSLAWGKLTQLQLETLMYILDMKTRKSVYSLFTLNLLN